MIRVRVELISAVTGRTTELARMHIINDGTSPKVTKGNYDIQTLRGRNRASLDKAVVNHHGRVENHSRLGLHVWSLVAKALKAVGYSDD